METPFTIRDACISSLTGISYTKSHCVAKNDPFLVWLRRSRKNGTTASNSVPKSRHLIYRDLNKFQDQTKPKEALYKANTSRLWFNHSKKRKDIAVRNASNASTKVFKGLFAHLRLNPPVKVCHKMKV